MSPWAVYEDSLRKMSSSVWNEKCEVITMPATYKTRKSHNSMKQEDDLEIFFLHPPEGSILKLHPPEGSILEGCSWRTKDDGRPDNKLLTLLTLLKAAKGVHVCGPVKDYWRTTEGPLNEWLLNDIEGVKVDKEVRGCGPLVHRRTIEGPQKDHWMAIEGPLNEWHEVKIDMRGRRFGVKVDKGKGWGGGWLPLKKVVLHRSSTHSLVVVTNILGNIDQPVFLGKGKKKTVKKRSGWPLGLTPPLPQSGQVNVNISRQVVIFGAILSFYIGQKWVKIVYK